MAIATDDAMSYDYLRDFYEQIGADSDGKNLSFLCKLCPAGLKKQVRTSASSITNLKRHVELKHPTSLWKYQRIYDDKKSLAMGKTLESLHLHPPPSCSSSSNTVIHLVWEVAVVMLGDAEDGWMGRRKGRRRRRREVLNVLLCCHARYISKYHHNV